MKTPSRLILEQIANSVSEGTAVVDPGNEIWRIVWFNKAFSKLCNAASGELANQSARELIKRLGGEAVLGKLTDAIAAGQSLSVTLIPEGAESPTPGALVLSVQPILNKDGTRSESSLFSLRRRSAVEQNRETHALRYELDEAHRKITAMSDDAVTGLASSEHFCSVLGRDIELARRESFTLSLMAFRMDAFEEYKATFGKHATDSCLRMLARTLSRRLKRGSDFGARADESTMVVLMHGGTHQSVAEFAEKIVSDVDALRIHHPKSPAAKYVTIRSNSILIQPDKNADASEILETLLTELNPVEPVTASFLTRQE